MENGNSPRDLFSELNESGSVTDGVRDELRDHIPDIGINQPEITTSVFEEFDGCFGALINHLELIDKQQKN